MKKIFTLLFFLSNAVSFAQWNKDPNVNTVVCTTPTNQLYHAMIPDGNGGAIITWEERSAGLDSSQIYAQHISEKGTLLWPAAGIPVSSTFLSILPHIVSDGEGGAIISWIDNPSGSLHLYIQKISATGVVQWAPGGIAVSPDAEINFFYKMISDGDGGATIIWPDQRNTQSQLYAQRISSDGTLLWQPDGVPCSPLFVSQFETMTDTATGGLFITWPKTTTPGYNTDIFVQRITGDGIALWGENGINICHGLKDQFNNKIISDGKAGAIVLWQDFREDPVLSGIYGQRVDSSGTAYWDVDGKLISDSVIPAVTYFQVISDGAGGGIVAWLDDFVLDQSNISNLYAQRFDSLGVTHWPGNKIAVWEDLSYLSPFQMTTDSEQGGFITWNHVSDTIPIGNENLDIYNIYAQRLLPNGLTQWPLSGTLVSSATQNQLNPQIAYAGNGAAIIAWTDSRSATNYDIYAAMVGSSPVPVEWLSFTAIRNGNAHILDWQIAGQENNKGFYIERSADGTHYESIGFVNSSGDSYSFTDSNPLEGVNYYRLKQVDIDDRFKYSKIIQLNIHGGDGILVYPNPVSTILKIKLKSGRAILHIINSYGAVVRIKNITSAGITDIDVNDLPAGVYYLKSLSNGEGWRMAGKFVKQ